ncbi:MAG: hypothetical protein DHS20C15_14140 [Planctomycetota bacterium]|nr:MAG: hypothetical protein DHS20C15_14140 [Planctomycetota bacterium]
MNPASRHDQASRLLAARPECIESGLAVLDDHLELAAGVHVDLLACDSLGEPVVVLFCDRDVAPVLARVASISAALGVARPLLRKLYGERGLDADRPARFALLAPRFADDTPQLLELLGPRELSAYEYRLIRTPDGEALLDLALFARSASPVAAAVVAAPAAEPSAAETPSVLSATNGAHAAASNGQQSEELTEMLEGSASPGSKALFQRARQSIRALSGEVAENHIGGRLEFRVDSQPLAALRLADDGLHLRVGEGELEQSVPDEASFNAGLNAVFTHYFSRIARRA